MKFEITKTFVLFIFCVSVVSSISVDNSTKDELESPTVFRADELPDYPSDEASENKSDSGHGGPDHEISEKVHNEDGHDHTIHEDIEHKHDHPDDDHEHIVDMIHKIHDEHAKEDHDNHNEEQSSHEHAEPEHSASSHEHSDHHHGHAHQVHLASWRWKEYGKMLVFTLVIVLAGMIKLGFHHTPILSEYLPESCALIICGIIMGAFVYIGGDPKHAQEYFPRFTSEIFFLVLLPPIILDAAYSIYNRHFLNNLGSVLVFAILGTLFNAFLIGFGLYFINKIGWMGTLPGGEKFDSISSLQFAALISAVDPVAVLAIFQEIGVNISLYFLVFGESLLNDGVSVVLYNSMGALGDIAASNEDRYVEKINYLLACLSFFTVVFGGFFVGLCVGFVTSFIVKFTKHTQVIEPFLILATGFFSYVLAETFHWSGIIGLIGCGIVQKRYAFQNISKSSLSTVKNLVTTLATFSDCVIFLFLGIVTVSRPNDLIWHWGFSLWTCLLCLIVRFAGVFILSAILNIRRIKKISIKEQIVIAYGGLRGAVGFSLAIILYQQKQNDLSKVFLATTLFMVYFTVFLQGGTIKFLVNKLKIAKEEEKTKLISDDVTQKTIDLVMSGMGSVLGGMNTHGSMEKIQSFDSKFIKKWLLRDQEKHAMTKSLQKISIEEHYARLYAPTLLAHQKGLGNVFQGMAPGKDVLSSNPAGQGENPRPKPLGNVVMDKIVLKNAFSANAFERERKSEYEGMSLVGSMKSFHEEDDINHVMEEQNKKANNIWRVAMSQMAEKNQALGTKAPSLASLGFAGQVKMLKQAYDEAQDAKDAESENTNVKGKARFKRIAHRYKDVVMTNENEVSSEKSSTNL